MKNSNIAIVLGGVVILLVGAAVFMYGQSDRKTVEGEEGTAASINSWPQTAEPLVKNSDYVINVGTAPAQPQIGVPAQLLIETTRDGRRVDIYEEERMLHVILSSEDRQDFLHTTSVSEEEPGLYSVTHEFAKEGRYRLWVEIDNYGSEHRHGEEAELLSFVDFAVTGDLSTQPATAASTTKEVVYNNYRVQLTDNTFTAGDISRLNWQVSHNGQVRALNDHEPAIYVIIGTDLEFFRHAHATPTDNLNEVVIEDTFPAAGRYLLWADTFVETGSKTDVIPAKFWITVTEN